MFRPDDEATRELVFSGDEVLEDQLRFWKRGPEFLIKPPNVWKTGLDASIAMKHNIAVVQLQITGEVSTIPPVASALERRSMIIA